MNESRTIHRLDHSDRHNTAQETPLHRRSSCAKSFSRVARELKTQKPKQLKKNKPGVATSVSKSDGSIRMCKRSRARARANARANAREMGREMEREMETGMDSPLWYSPEQYCLPRTQRSLFSVLYCASSFVLLVNSTLYLEIYSEII